MTTTKTDDRIPTPLYAAAGVGDIAYQQLRKLPGVVAELPAKVAELRGKVNDADNTLVDVDKIREAAKRNAEAFKTSAHAAQLKAVALYTDLVTRGQQAVHNGKTGTEVAKAPAAKAPAKTDVVDAVVVAEEPKPKKSSPKK